MTTAAWIAWTDPPQTYCLAVPRRLPVFPLGNVLMPHGLLPLHIFEQRYRTLMADLLENGNGPGHADAVPRPVPEMGVVLIERGHEVGGGDERSGLGTVARIVRAEKLADGRWFALAAGSVRFSVASWLPDDPYPLAEVVELPREDWDGRLDDLLRSAEREVRRALALAGELGEPAAQPELSEDPSIAAWQLCDAAPVGAFDRQKLLAADGFGARLALLEALASDASSMLAFRLGG